MRSRKDLAAIVVTFGFASLLQAAELVTLHPGNYKEYAPAGPETEAIFGDYVLRNDLIVAVVGDPTLCRGRSASRKNLPFPLGLVIDLTLRAEPNDLLFTFTGSLMECTWRDMVLMAGDPGDPYYQSRCTDEALAYKNPGREPQSGKSVSLTLPCKSPGVSVRYTLADGWPYLQADMVYDTESLRQLKKPFRPTCSLLMAGNATLGGDPEGYLNWAYDLAGGQAYGVTSELFPAKRVPGLENYIRAVTTGTQPFPLPGDKTFNVTRRLFPARDLFQLRGLVNAARTIPQQPFSLTVTDAEGPVSGATVTAKTGDTFYAAGRTSADGRLAGNLPAGQYDFHIGAIGRGDVSLTVDPARQHDYSAALDVPARLRLTVTDGEQRPIPCKVEFRGLGDTPSPRFDRLADRVGNLAYTADGKVEQALPAGRYRLLVTHGPEFDYADPAVELRVGKVTERSIALARTVDTRGWISAEFGNLSTISRAVSSLPVAGRVLNLAAEQIEFAPACEVDQVFTYETVIRELGLEPFLKSCPGIGLSQRGRKSVTRQNAFPAKYTPGAQDGGAVQRPQHVNQVFWLNGWYGPTNFNYRAVNEKLIQVTPPSVHPLDGRWHGMWSLFSDPGMPNAFGLGHESILPSNRLLELSLYDAMEVQPLESFLDLPAFSADDPDGAADIRAWQREMNEWSRKKEWPDLKKPNLEWLRMLNMGYRITGIVNGNANDHFHGSGRYRNYIGIGVDDPSLIDPLAVVRAVKAGRVVMSTGPFLDVKASAGGQTAGIGDDLAAPGGQASLAIRLQAQRGTVMDRVRLLFNGRPVPSLTRTRESHPDLFHDGPLQFAADIPITVSVDTRVMVLADGWGPDLWNRVAATNKEDATSRPARRRHVVMSNPIFLDIAGDGFRPSPPWQDRVFTYLDWEKPLLSSTGAPPSEWVLKLKNVGTETAEDSFAVRIEPSGLAEVVGDNRFSYRIESGGYREIRFEVRLIPGAVPASATPTLRVSVARSSASTGRRPTACSLRVDQTEKKLRSSDPVDRGWLPEHDPQAPPSLMWPEAPRRR